MNKELIIDVGANYGLFSLEIAERNPDKLVIAFEPEPSLAVILKNKAQEKGLDNHIVETLAVSTTSGKANLFVSKEGDWGTSSLKEFNKTNVDSDVYWSERKDLSHSESLLVATTTLDDYLDKIEYSSIKFLKIDAQGLDLEVLLSMGKHISRLEGGMLEVSVSREKALYVNELSDLREALNAVYDLGLTVYSVKPNDPASNEFNVFFRRNDVTQSQLESSSNLNGIEIYDGKNFWHYPSHALINVDQILSDLNSKLLAQAQEIDTLSAQLKRIRTHPIIRFLLAARRLLNKIKLI